MYLPRFVSRPLIVSVATHKYLAVESGGAALPYQAEVFPDKEHFGRIFYNMANLSAAAIPSVSPYICDPRAALTMHTRH